MIRKLKKPKIDEVSLVDKAANLRSFFFVKNSKKEEGLVKKAITSIRIDSDGTYDGTTISIDNVPIDPEYFNFSTNAGDEYYHPTIDCYYTLSEKAEKGEFSTMCSYSLQKNKKNQDDSDETISNVVPEDCLEKFAKNIDILVDIKDIVPPEVREAITNLEKAVNVDETESEETQTEKEKEMEDTKEVKKTEDGAAKTENTEEAKTEETKETTETKEGTETNAEQTKPDKAAESKPDVVVMEQKDFDSLLAKLTTQVADSVVAKINAEKQAEEEVEIDLDQIAEMVQAAAAG